MNKVIIQSIYQRITYEESLVLYLLQGLTVSLDLKIQWMPQFWLSEASSVRGGAWQEKMSMAKKVIAKYGCKLVIRSTSESYHQI